VLCAHVDFGSFVDGEFVIAAAAAAAVLLVLLFKN
jgi:hypothetical protein